MIRVKNLGEERVDLKSSGSASVANNIANFSAPYDGTLQAILAIYGVQGTDGTGSPTQDIVLDLKKNGTSIFSGATKINFSHALQLGTANTSISADNIGALTADPTVVKKGDYFRLDCTQILNGTNPTQPTDLTVHLVFTRKFQSPKNTLKGQVTSVD